MIRTKLAMIAGALLAAGVAVAQAPTSAQTPATPNAPAQTEAQAPMLPSGPSVNAELNSSLDSKKAKAGDKVEAHTTEAMEYGGKVIVPKGAKLEGRVTEATARSKGDSGSTLAIQFDKAIAKKGEEIPLNVVLLAVAAPQPVSFSGSAGPGSDPMNGVGASAAGGSPMGVGKPQPPPNQTPNAAPVDAEMTTNGSGPLPVTSRGVYGLKGLKLMMTTTKSGQTTVLTSDGKDVRLESGTRLLLVAQTTTPPSPAPSR
ncbi:MAG: hypothetical protein WBG02_15415 [Candidatus Acidiferrum sp.]